MFPKFIASQFKKPAGIFGNLIGNIMTKSNRSNYDRLIKDLNPGPNEKLLEIGYGPGIGIQLIARICDSCQIHGIDMVNADFLIKKKTPDNIFNKYSIEEVVEVLKSAGFGKIEHYFNKGYYIQAVR